MQAVILAAGKGTRLRPLTNDRPKAMVALLGKPIVEHTINALPECVTEIIFIISPDGGLIREHFGDSWKGRPVTYVIQEPPLGTADALFKAQTFIDKKPFLVVPGDNVSSFSGIDESVFGSYTIFAFRTEHPERFGVIELNEDGVTLGRLQEKPEHPKTNLISTSSMVLEPNIFNYKPILNEDYGEYFIPDLLMQVLQDHSIRVVEQDFWVAVDRPEDIPQAEKALIEYGISS